MSTARRHDLVGHANVTDEEQTYKKAFQTVGRPAVTERDIHEDYMNDPPNNQPFEPNTDRNARGLKEGAMEETDPKQDGVLGNAGTGKLLKQDALEDIVTGSSVHPGNPLA
ncbi:hypothetical protein C8Q80DRAFT_382778 [Daedaleopsis nitida]|nr:hypothetical protein C8Q80DRAFT_382778 [Daedaleopsis nitida]